MKLVRNTKKVIFIICGCICLVAGVIGIVVPVLPTTPLLLLAAFCFTQGSKRLDNWFKKSDLYKNYVHEFIQHRSMTLKTKICILALSTTMMTISLVLVPITPLKVLLVALIVYMYYYFIAKIKTVSTEEMVRLRTSNEDISY